ncbi:MAG: DUF4358 domain-containing protein [Oscillospiraceae bacterium]|nr:DUF4358 domain-containing protein [Oscillospiraceae bacterium]
MKKVLLVTLALILLLSGCESDGNTNGESNAAALESVSPQTIAESIFESIEIPASVQKTKEELPDFIGGLDISNIHQIAYFICASGASPDELLIIKFNHADDAANAKSHVQTRLDSRKKDFQDYRPDEMVKFNGALVQINANWLFFYITEDNAKVKEIISSYING